MHNAQFVTSSFTFKYVPSTDGRDDCSEEFVTYFYLINLMLLQMRQKSYRTVKQCRTSPMIHTR
jgi:hypothetical protein